MEIFIRIADMQHEMHTTNFICSLTQASHIQNEFWIVRLKQLSASFATQIMSQSRLGKVINFADVCESLRSGRTIFKLRAGKQSTCLKSRYIASEGVCGKYQPVMRQHSGLN